MWCLCYGRFALTLFFLVEPAVAIVRLFECVISGFCHVVAENCALLDYYAMSSGNFLPMFWDNLSLPSPGFKNPKRNCQYSLCNNPDEHSSQALWIFEHVYHIMQCYFPKGSIFLSPPWILQNHHFLYSCYCNFHRLLAMKIWKLPDFYLSCSDI